MSYKFNLGIFKRNNKLLWVLLVRYFLILNVSNCEEVNDFVSFTYYENGELETLIKFGGISAKEISVANKNESGLSLRQISNGKRFLQLIYDEESLKECNYIQEKDQVEKFLNSFNPANFYNSSSTSKVIVDNLRDRNLPPNVKSWFNFRRMKKLCHQKLREIKSELKKLEKRRLEEMEQENLFGRTRRDISDFLRVPGTQWCGKGYSAKKYTDVGMFSQTDRCCRKHDLACPYWIGGFQMKYGVRNNMINTLMHCSCDERFRACLKRVGTIDANLVGNIFFNFVQRECFTLEPKNKCDKKKFNNLKLKKNDSMKSIKVKNSNVRRRKRNERKCRRKNSERKATIRRNLVY
ncbi:uncharacterized protein [Onthophagus taurus]|uniref:uncharacterized protein isoform X2 n=1 Tax=Onthophagus taurus TaxID=166361 RepID=UPI0039BDB61A